MKVMRLVVMYGALLSVTLLGSAACMTDESTEEYIEEPGDEAPAEDSPISDDSEIVTNATSGCTVTKNKKSASSFCTHGTGTHRVRIFCASKLGIVTRFGPWVATRKTSSKACSSGESLGDAAVDTKD